LPKTVSALLKIFFTKVSFFLTMSEKLDFKVANELRLCNIRTLPVDANLSQSI